MTWVTRKRIHVNRTATTWLIRRFVDPGATVLFVDADQVAEVQRRGGARGFDAPGATYPHRDPQGRCSFEALRDKFVPGDAALHELGRIVHGADFADEVGLTPESAGLRAISSGFPLVTGSDDETAAQAAFIYDSLYAALKQRLKGTDR
ncbi:MAG: chromate resistance protein [Deltaproteobacteria bacterium]|nr:chromate resistance protein [Deltaproteobacteria bacterium]